jgi:hypothetical protein
MHGSREIIEEAGALPVEERALIIDSLLRTLNPPDASIHREWIAAATRRLGEIRSGGATPVPGNEVFEKLQKRFEK